MAEGLEPKTLTIDGGRVLILRPISPEDEQALVEMALRTTPEDLRLRFFSYVRPEIGALTDMLTHFDRDRQIAMGAYEAEGGDDGGSPLGVVRLVLSEDGRTGEFALIVRSDQAGQGLGHAFMGEMLAWARDRGLARIEGEVLRENRRMLRLVSDFGATIRSSDREAGTVRLVIEVTPTG